MRKIGLIYLFVLLGIVGYSQTTSPRAEIREKAERARIHQGRKNGEITNREAAALNTEQRSIRRSERRAKRDGELTSAEKRRVERKQDRASRHIRRAKKNKMEQTSN